MRDDGGPVAVEEDLPSNRLRSKASIGDPVTSTVSHDYLEAQSGHSRCLSGMTSFRQERTSALPDRKVR